MSLLFSRDDTCGVPNYSRCADKALPSNFCCPTGSTCVSILQDTAAICCPSGSNCAFIRPIVCDVRLQNATFNPSGTFKSTVLNYTMETCGANGGCCPRGYNCRDGMCAAVPNLASSSNSSLSNSSMIVPLEPPACPAYPGRAVAAGFFPGMILAFLISAAIWWFLIKRKEEKDSNRSSFGRVRAAVSDPIYASPNDGAFRTDFLRRVSRLRPGGTRTPVNNDFHNSSTTNLGVGGITPSSYSPDLPHGSHGAVCPRHQRQSSTPPLPTPPPLIVMRQAERERGSYATDGGQTTFSVLLHHDDMPGGLFSRQPHEPRAL